MDRCTYMEIGGKNYPLRMSLAAAEKINEKYGSTEEMLERMKDEKTCIPTYVDVLELLISQGCAYKNTFEKDLPAEGEAPVKEGAWVPLTEEEIALGVDRRRIGEIVGKIAEAAGFAVKNEVSAKTDSKKRTVSINGSRLIWFHYWARALGLSWAEYHLLTTGQIEDLVLCHSAANGTLEETEENGYIPDVR